MNYDAVLKTILEALAPRVISHLTGSRIADMLSVEFSTVERRVPDLVCRLEDGRILHLELQATNDGRMVWRMLQYWLLLKQRFPHERLIQLVLYVGEAPLAMASSLDSDNLQYRYELHDIREFDEEALLASESAPERALAVLCRTDDILRTVRRVIDSWAGRPERELEDLMAKLVIILGLRKLPAAFEEEVQKMPITFTTEEIQRMEKLQQLLERSRQLGREQGLEQGEAKILRQLLLRRFGEIPAWTNARIDGASTAQLELWAERILDAGSLDEMFA